MKQHPGTFIAGALFTVLGFGYLLEVFDVWEVDLSRSSPVALIVAALVVIWNARRDQPPAPPPPEGTAG